MKKSIKRISALILALVFSMLMPMSAFALSVADDTSTVVAATNTSTATVNITSGNTNDTLSLYKIVNVVMQNNTLKYTFTDAFKAYLTAYGKSDSVTEETYLTYTTDSTTLKTLLDEFGVYVNTMNHDTKEVVKENSQTETVLNTDNDIAPSYIATTGKNTSVAIENVALGQYVILSSGNSDGTYVYETATVKIIPHAVNGAYKLYSVYNVEMKTSKPTMNKSIETTSAVTPTNDDKLTATIGDKITYKIEATIPIFPVGATNKTLYISDTPPAGLTVDVSSIRVIDKTGNAFSDASSKETIKYNANDFSKSVYHISYDDKTGTIYVDINYDMIMKTTSPERIIIEYDAMINGDAEIKNENKNTAQYVYSNNPYLGSTYDPVSEKSENRPEPGENTEYAYVESTASVYTYGLAIEKVDQNDTSIKLVGATFEIYNNSACEGTPIGTITTDTNGVAFFDGIRADVYYLKEVTAPAGYTLPTGSDAITKIDISDSESTKSYTTTTTLTYTSNKAEAFNYGKTDALVTQATNSDGARLYISDTKTNAVTTDVTDYPAYVKSVVTTQTASGSTGVQGLYVYKAIQNKAAETVSLPGTGSIGIVPFVVVGSVLMIGAAIILVTRRRMKGTEE
jgi:fimbrial isopeptide formation D2 family protein/LPXTG-motif cell wall-anchored protein